MAVAFVDQISNCQMYVLCSPGLKKVHQMGVQGGLLIFRPNATDFQRNVDIIRSGGNFHNTNWGDSLGYGGYYGAGTIQVRCSTRGCTRR
jgi:hypothetical protein